MSYVGQALSFSDRIFAAIEKHPEILEITNPFDLFKVASLDCTDVDTFAQASAALSTAKERWKNK